MNTLPQEILDQIAATHFKDQIKDNRLVPYIDPSLSRLGRPLLAILISVTVC